MNSLFDFLFEAYATYSLLDIALEFSGVSLGVLGVWFAKKNSTMTYPVGMISTGIFVYLLWKWSLLGDMIINAYYFIMSIYGWFFWQKKQDGIIIHTISKSTIKENRIGILIFTMTLSFVAVIYSLFEKWNSWTAYTDTFTTGIFFVGMWFMTRRKIEHWIFWIVGNVISVPLYFHKGLALTAIQYVIFTIIAFYGYQKWKQIVANKTPQTA